jgi:hypothetical protein
MDCSSDRLSYFPNHPTLNDLAIQGKHNRLRRGGWFILGKGNKGSGWGV